VFTSEAGRCFWDRFRRTSGNGWTHIERIMPLNASQYTEYGRSFMALNNMLMISSSGYARSGNEEKGRGAVYVFEQGAASRPMPTANPTNKKEMDRAGPSRWMNLLLSVLLLYFIKIVFPRRPTAQTKLSSIEFMSKKRWLPSFYNWRREA
jgi:hypothetical protein